VETQNRSDLTLARVFVIGQLTAMGFLALTAVASAATWGEPLAALPAVAAFGLTAAAALYFRLPRLLSERLSPRRLRWVAVIVSVLGVAVGYDHATSLLTLDRDLLLSAGLGLTRALAVPVLGLFIVALVVVLVTILVLGRRA
jgi:hypothetical protein